MNTLDVPFDCFAICYLIDSTRRSKISTRTGRKTFLLGKFVAAKRKLGNLICAWNIFAGIYWNEIEIEIEKHFLIDWYIGRLLIDTPHSLNDTVNYCFLFNWFNWRFFADVNREIIFI